MIKVVVFDLDDTLYDASSCYEKGTKQLALYVQNTFGIQEAEFEAKFWQAKEKVKSRLENVAASHNRLLYCQNFLEMIDKCAPMYAIEMYDVYWDTVLKEMKLYSYVMPLFRMLRKKDIKIAVLSDLTAHIQHRKIRSLGIESYIDVLVTSEEAGEEKPSQRMFELVMEKTGFSANEMLMIGDNKERDIQGAKALGIEAILYQNDKDIIGEVEKLL